MQIHYLEIVTLDNDSVCHHYETLHDVKFEPADSGLGNARTAKFANGGMIGVRLPMSETESPIVRPYLLVEDMDQALLHVAESGGEVMHPPLQIHGHGTFAIYSLVGNQHGLWTID